MEITGPAITTEREIQIGLVLLGIVIAAILFRPKTAKAEEITEPKKDLLNYTIDPTKPLAERIKDLQARLGIDWGF